MIRVPLFIVFEGIDGSGKSTQAAMAAEWLRESGVPVTELREPGDSRYGREIREYMKSGRMPPPDEQLRLFLLDREEDVRERIAPALADGSALVLDRYFYSNAAYQGAGGIDPEGIIRENLSRGFPLPDRVYCIDIDPALALARVGARGQAREAFERGVFLESVRAIYRSIADGRFLMIDGALPREEAARIIRDDLARNFSSPGGTGS